MKSMVFLILVFPASLMAQLNLRDSVVKQVIVGVNYKFNLSGGDLNDRWGFNNIIGADVQRKFKNNLTFGIDGGFIFGNQLKDTTIFDDLYTSFGTITAMSGAPAVVNFLMRGAHANVGVGYVFNKLGDNPNSGIWVNAGVGYLMHKIHIETLYDDVPQLEGDYRKGYDHLTMGIATKQFIGYLFQHNRRFLSFYGGFEFIQGFNKNVRNYNFNSNGPDSGLKIDLMYSFKFGWVVPIYKRYADEVYYD